MRGHVFPPSLSCPWPSDIGHSLHTLDILFFPLFLKMYRGVCLFPGALGSPAFSPTLNLQTISIAARGKS